MSNKFDNFTNEIGQLNEQSNMVSENVKKLNINSLTNFE